MLNADEVRQAFLDYQVERGHHVLERASLVPRDDPTTLFNGSGMQSLLPYLLGAEHPFGTLLCDSQPCLRAQDIEDVGDNRHTTFFEMLGNWSLGAYFKAEQLPAVWTLLIERLGLDGSRLYVSCFAGDPEHDIPKDDESARIWKEIFERAGLDAEQADLGSEEQASQVGNQGARICFYEKKNWWCRGGTPDKMPVGDPGGPDSELFYLFPDLPHDTAYGELCHPNCDCGRYMEIGNSVFMQYRKTESGFDQLPRRNVDFGGGLERLAAAAIDSDDVFRISLLWPIIERLETLSRTTYAERTRELRIVADHLRGATFLAVDGVVPSNTKQGYVMRRLLRRAIRIAFGLGLTKTFFADIVPTIADLYHDTYPEVAANRDRVIAVLVKEEKGFRRTLKMGLSQLRGMQGRTITGADLFLLSDTHGFPVELSVEEVQNQGFDLSPTWREEFEEQLEAQRTRSRAGGAG